MTLIFNWGVASFFGWGVYGLNLMRHWPRSAGLAVTPKPISEASIARLPMAEQKALAPAIEASARLRASLEPLPAGPVTAEAMVLHGLGNSLLPQPVGNGISLAGRSTAAVAFVEDTALEAARERTRPYRVVVAGSRWNESLLRAHGVENVATVIQGVDPAVFHPGPRTARFSDRFVVFTGGKIERRKGQDLAILGFRAFAARHPEAVLLTAWYSPWSDLTGSINANPAIAPLAHGPGGAPDVAGWLAANGLAPHQVLVLGPVHNAEIGTLLRDVDVGLFPNRAEGGTNLVAMECMASGIPVIVSDNTGHRDLVATGATIPLTRQGAVSHADWVRGTEGWGESDVEEIDAALERVWADRAFARAKGAEAAAALASLSWERQIGRLHDTLQRFLP